MTNLTNVVERFLEATAGDVSQSTRKWYRQLLGQFATFVGPTPVATVNRSHLRAYRAHLVERGLSQHSIHGHQRAIRRLFSWLVTEGDLTENPALAVPLVRLPAQTPKAVTDSDLDKLLERLPAESVRDRAIILFLIDTGCRIGGLCSLTLDALDIPGRCAVVTEKGGRSRRVYFSDLTADALALHLATRPEANSPALFLSNKGTALTSSGVRLMLERVGQRAGVTGRINAHAFRHAFARTFLRNGGNLAALGRLMGHAPGSPITAKYYAVFDDAELQDFHRRYSPLAHMRD